MSYIEHLRRWALARGPAGLFYFAAALALAGGLLVGDLALKPVLGQSAWILVLGLAGAGRGFSPVRVLGCLAVYAGLAAGEAVNAGAAGPWLGRILAEALGLPVGSAMVSLALATAALGLGLPFWGGRKWPDLLEHWGETVEVAGLAAWRLLSPKPRMAGPEARAARATSLPRRQEMSAPSPAPEDSPLSPEVPAAAVPQPVQAEPEESRSWMMADLENRYRDTAAPGRPAAAPAPSRKGEGRPHLTAAKDQVAADRAWIKENLERRLRARAARTAPQAEAKTGDTPAVMMDEEEIRQRLKKIHGGRIPGDPRRHAPPAPQSMAAALLPPAMPLTPPPVIAPPVRPEPRPQPAAPRPAGKPAPAVPATAVPAPAVPVARPMPGNVQPGLVKAEGPGKPAFAPVSVPVAAAAPAVPAGPASLPGGEAPRPQSAAPVPAQRLEPEPVGEKASPATPVAPAAPAIPVPPVAEATVTPAAAEAVPSAPVPEIPAAVAEEPSLPSEPEALAPSAEEKEDAANPGTVEPASPPAAMAAPAAEVPLADLPWITVEEWEEPDPPPARDFLTQAAPEEEDGVLLAEPLEEEPFVESPEPGYPPGPRRWENYAPPLDLLQPPVSSLEPVDQEGLARQGRLIEEKLAEFKVNVTVQDACAGPVITRYEVEPAVGVRGSQVVNLMKDLARALGVTAIRVVETIPGKTYMGLELPNPRRQMIRLSEVLSSEVFQGHGSKLAMALGKDITGNPVVADLAKAPHMLVAGTTGSGKSVGVNGMILSLLYRASPAEVRMVMIDPKMLELSVYDGIPHLLAPVVTDMKLAANALNWCVGEMERRYRLMSFLGVRNLAGYNQKVAQARDNGRPIFDPFPLVPESPTPLEHLPFIVVVVDEFADLMMVAGKKIEELIARLAQKARAAGIHLILATQRPSVDVITGLIKANIPTRIAFQVSSKIDSRTILDQMGAETLLGQGDMLYLPPGTGYPQRVHGAFVADEEVHALAEHLKQYGEPDYVDAVLGGEPEGEPGEGEGSTEELDPLYDQAVAIVIDSRRASISLIQRHLRIGYNRAARLVEQMEMSGVVSPMESNGSRTVLVPAS